MKMGYLLLQKYQKDFLMSVVGDPATLLVKYFQKVPGPCQVRDENFSNAGGDSLFRLEVKNTGGYLIDLVSKTIKPTYISKIMHCFLVYSNQ